MHRVKGDPTKRRHTLGPYPATSLADARTEARQLIIDTAKGIDVNNLKMAAAKAPDIKGLVDEYIEKWAKPRKRSWKEDQRILNKDVLPHWKRRKAADITRRNVVLLLDGIVDRGAPIAANRTLAVIRKMFNFCGVS